VSVVELLLKDPRVDITLDDNMGRSPLWWASYNGSHEVIEWFIASGRDFGDVKSKKTGRDYDGKDYTALENARKNKDTEAASLLERFMANPELTMHEIRVKLGLQDALAAELYAVTIFMCDDLLQLKETSTVATAVTRFFAITESCPWSCR